MPIHEYECERCGAKFERLEMAGDGPAVCGSCGGPAKKLLSAPGKPRMGGPGGRETCCGMAGGCDNPKRCCGS
ncbi:MAG: zinc ribbon domain-containing protein [Deltaproteobacteria bacterium]|nr:zinc ribbon domain-containing protein [Deltaproteobacteria bacterium]